MVSVNKCRSMLASVIAFALIGCESDLPTEDRRGAGDPAIRTGGIAIRHPDASRLDKQVGGRLSRMEQFKPSEDAPLEGPLVKTAAVSRTVSFDNETALKDIVNQARATWASWSRTNSSGQVVNCDPATQECKMYREYSSTAGKYIHVMSAGPGHFHLGFENPRLGECFVQSGFGYLENGSCLAPNWAKEKRTATVHDGGSWFEIASRKSENSGYPAFDLNSIRGASTPFQLWYRRADNGEVWGWGELESGVDHPVNARVTAVWVGPVEGAGSPATLERFTVGL